jgi:hypothetical protein
MQQGLCPLPDEVLIENQPFFNELFDFGTETGSPYDETYVTYNFVQFMPLQQLMLDRYREDRPIPMCVRQKDLRFNQLGAYEYSMCSWRCMYEAVASNYQRYMFSHIASGRGIRLNFYGDFDMSMGDVDEESIQSGKCVNDAIREVYACLRIMINQQQQLNNADFADIEPDPLAILTYAHREGKQSAHVVFFLMLKPTARRHEKVPYKMFADVMDCRHFYYNVLLTSAKRHTHKRDNPLYFRIKGQDAYMCIMDPKVYRTNGLMRMIMCMKRDGRDVGRLTPDCGTKTRTCDHAATCVYHGPQPRLSMQEFCANEMRFVPRKKDGSPMDIDLLRIARIDNPDLKANAKGLHSDASMSALCHDEDSHAHTPVQRSRAPRQGMFESAAKVAIMEHIAFMLQHLTGYRCVFAGSMNQHSVTGGEGDMGLIASASLECMYKGKRENPQYTVDNVKTLKHSSNHIFYNAIINLPLPLVLVNCTSPKCEPFIANLKTTLGQAANNFRRLHVDFSSLPHELLDTYHKLVANYVRCFMYTF